VSEFRFIPRQEIAALTAFAVLSAALLRQCLPHGRPASGVVHISSGRGAVTDRGTADGADDFRARESFTTSSHVDDS
jgi:hypothetical protein